MPVERGHRAGARPCGQTSSRSRPGTSIHTDRCMFGYTPTHPLSQTLRQQPLELPGPGVAAALGHHDKTTTRRLDDTGGTWSRYILGDHTRPPADCPGPWPLALRWARGADSQQAPDRRPSGSGLEPGGSKSKGPARLSVAATASSSPVASFGGRTRGGPTAPPVGPVTPARSVPPVEETVEGPGPGPAPPADSWCWDRSRQQVGGAAGGPGRPGPRWASRVRAARTRGSPERRSSGTVRASGSIRAEVVPDP